MSDQTVAPENTIAQIEDGETTHYICQIGNELTERDFDGELGPPELLGSAKPGTPGTYVLVGEKREFYCLNEGSALQDFTFDDETGEWALGQLAALGAIAAPEADIAATQTSDGRFQVFFQDPQDTIWALSRGTNDARWRAIGDNLPPTRPVARARMAAMAMKDVIHLFYTHQDSFIHELVHDGKKWTDAKVALTETATRKTGIVVTPGEQGQDYTLQFTTADEEVYAVQDGELTLMGRYVDGVFRKNKGAEGWNSRGPRMVYRAQRRWWW